MDNTFSQNRSQPWQVGELLAMLHQRIDADFGAIRVEGEVSDLTNARSGHRYFSLKDPDGQIRCAWFRSSIRGQTIAEGQHVIAHGRLSIYTPRGDLQMIVQAVEDAGEGALAAAFERLKRQLAAEGLFDRERKLPLQLPATRIAIISSPQAAALQDILVTLRRRDPFMQLRLIAVPVQGLEAPARIAEALHAIHADDDLDAIVLARGGGSLEDLQAFNTEIVARAIASCQKPVISAVGHETDITISDLVASLRAPTPTAAAEMVSRDRGAQAQTLAPLRRRLHAAAQRLRDQQARRLQDWLRRLQIRSPQRQLETQAQSLDRALLRLQRATTQAITMRQQALVHAGKRLERANPATRTRDARRQQADLANRLNTALGRRLALSQTALKSLQRRLESLNPARVLQRGYALVHVDDTLVTQAREFPQGGSRLQLTWHDGVRVFGTDGLDVHPRTDSEA